MQLWAGLEDFDCDRRADWATAVHPVTATFLRGFDAAASDALKSHMIDWFLSLPGQKRDSDKTRLLRDLAKIAKLFGKPNNVPVNILAAAQDILQRADLWMRRNPHSHAAHIKV